MIVRTMEPTKFLTMVNREYWPGFLTLAYSLSKNAGSQVQRLTVLQEETIPHEIRSQVSAFGLQCEYVDTAILARFESPVVQVHQRLNFAFKKLALLKYPHDGVVCLSTQI